MLLILNVDFDEVLSFELASQDGFRKRIFDVVLDGSSQRFGPRIGIETLVGEECLGTLRPLTG